MSILLLRSHLSLLDPLLGSIAFSLQTACIPCVETATFEQFSCVPRIKQTLKILPVALHSILYQHRPLIVLSPHLLRCTIVHLISPSTRESQKQLSCTIIHLRALMKLSQIGIYTSSYLSMTYTSGNLTLSRPPLTLCSDRPILNIFLGHLLCNKG